MYKYIHTAWYNQVNETTPRQVVRLSQIPVLLLYPGLSMAMSVDICTQDYFLLLENKWRQLPAM